MCRGEPLLRGHPGRDARYGSGALPHLSLTVAYRLFISTGRQGDRQPGTSGAHDAVHVRNKIRPRLWRGHFTTIIPTDLPPCRRPVPDSRSRCPVSAYNAASLAAFSSAGTAAPIPAFASAHLARIPRSRRIYQIILCVGLQRSGIPRSKLRLGLYRLHERPLKSTGCTNPGDIDPSAHCRQLPSERPDS